MVLCGTAAQNSSSGPSPEMDGRAVRLRWDCGDSHPPSLVPPFLLQGEGFNDPSEWSLWEEIHPYYWISQSPIASATSRNSVKPASEGPVDVHRKIKKAKALSAVSDHRSGHELWGETALGPVTYIWWRPGKDQSLSAGLVDTSAKGEHFSLPCSSLLAGPLQTAWL